MMKNSQDNINVFASEGNEYSSKGIFIKLSSDNEETMTKSLDNVQKLYKEEKENWLKESTEKPLTSSYISDDPFADFEYEDKLILRSKILFFVGIIFFPVWLYVFISYARINELNKWCYMSVVMFIITIVCITIGICIIV